MGTPDIAVAPGQDPPSPGRSFFLKLRVGETGGSIMIHGLPNFLKHPPQYYESHDWTDGCIAVTNADMVEIWLLTPDSTPIDIRP